MVLGDFNFMLSSTNKHNGEDVSSYQISDFQECCFDLGLHDVNYIGCHFSWSNGTVWSKLDRVLINPSCAFTDHSPAEVRLDHFVQGKRNFKFFNI